MFSYIHLSFWLLKLNAWPLWTVKPAFFDLIGHLKHFERCLIVWSWPSYKNELLKLFVILILNRVVHNGVQQSSIKNIKYWVGQFGHIQLLGGGLVSVNVYGSYDRFTLFFLYILFFFFFGISCHECLIFYDVMSSSSVVPWGCWCL